MKSSTLRLMIAAAALVVAAGTASAQTYKAEIPMAFRAAGKLMTPGSYEIRVSRNTATELVFVRNIDAKSAVILVAQVKADPPKEWRKTAEPKVGFACIGGACNLSSPVGRLRHLRICFPLPQAPGRRSGGPNGTRDPEHDQGTLTDLPTSRRMKGGAASAAPFFLCRACSMTRQVRSALNRTVHGPEPWVHFRGQFEVGSYYFQQLRFGSGVAFIAPVSRDPDRAARRRTRQ